MLPFLLMGIFGLVIIGKKSRMSGPKDLFYNYVSRALTVIRKLESGNNYRAQNPRSSASGAYQFLDTTWGNFKGYTRAMNAPASVQDEKARQMVVKILENNGYDIRWVPAIWYAGSAGAKNIDWDTTPGKSAGNKLSIRQYVNKWMNLLYRTS